MDIKDNEYVTYSDKPKAISKEQLEKYGEDMLRKLGASDEQIAEAKEQIKDCDDKLDSEIVDDEDLEVENLKEKYTNSKSSREENEPGENYKRYPSFMKKKAGNELDEYQKDLEEYLSKNKKGREDIPVGYRR